MDRIGAIGIDEFDVESSLDLSDRPSRRTRFGCRSATMRASRLLPGRIELAQIGPIGIDEVELSGEVSCGGCQLIALRGPRRQSQGRWVLPRNAGTAADGGQALADGVRIRAVPVGHPDATRYVCVSDAICVSDVVGKLRAVGRPRRLIGIRDRVDGLAAGDLDHGDRRRRCHPGGPPRQICRRGTVRAVSHRSIRARRWQGSPGQFRPRGCT